MKLNRRSTVVAQPKAISFNLTEEDDVKSTLTFQRNLSKENSDRDGGGSVQGAYAKQR
jgi:hypothetical protein